MVEDDFATLFVCRFLDPNSRKAPPTPTNPNKHHQQQFIYEKVKLMSYCKTPLACFLFLTIIVNFLVKSSIRLDEAKLFAWYLPISI